MKRVIGTHMLAFQGVLQPGDGKKVETAARISSSAGATLMELTPEPLNTMPADEMGSALLAGGISEFSLCRFFPGGPTGETPCGDPLGDDKQHRAALRTIESDLKYIEGLRKCGLICEFMTGPNGYVLGKQNVLQVGETRKRFAKYYGRVAVILQGTGVRACLEYLKPDEDQGYVGSMNEACVIMDQIPHPEIAIHFDTFHSHVRRENMRAAILRAGNRLAYVHANGSRRLHPGASGPSDLLRDHIDWKVVSQALDEMKYRGPIVVEPFGDIVLKQVPALADGVAEPMPPEDYFPLAFKTLRMANIIS